MPSEKDGIMIILSSPSGAGKTTLVKKLSEKDNFEISISHTTRQPRPNEIQKEDYFFVDELEFKRLIKNEEFLEYAEVFKNFYGSEKKKIYQNLQEGKNVVFDIDWQGTEQIKNKKLNFKIITIFILPPSKKNYLQDFQHYLINLKQPARLHPPQSKLPKTKLALTFFFLQFFFKFITFNKYHFSLFVEFVNYLKPLNPFHKIIIRHNFLPMSNFPNCNRTRCKFPQS